MAAPNYDYMYQPGGSLGVRAPSYVPRQADDDLYEGIKSGRFCYVFNCRQMGKSSLRVRVSKRLEQDGYRCATLDLTAVGGDEHLTPAQWYRSLITELNRSLSLLSVTEFDAWLAASDGLTAVYALSQFIEDVVLAKTSEQPVVIFIDEIDSVLSLSFDTTDLFAMIRNCYNKRADNPDYARLNFSLFGVATPAKLMRDTSRTPFNIGKAIRLMPLDLAQAKPLEKGLLGWAEEPQQVLKAIFDWTGGQPYLTQRLCELVQGDGMAHGAIVVSRTVERVAKLVEKNILENWQLQDEQSHLKTIQDRMLRQSSLTNRVVALYGQVLKKGEVVAESNDEATVELRLSGIVVQTEQKLRSFNRIYQCVFSADWVMKTLGELRPHSMMFESWVASGSKDRANLLRGEALKAAESWAEGKSLSDLDNRYLRESQADENKRFQKWARASTLVSGIVAAGMLVAATISYKAYVDIEKKVITSQLKVIANNSRSFLSEDETIDALTTAVRGGQIVKELDLQATQEGALVLAVLHQARYPNSTFNVLSNSNVQRAYSFREHNRLSGRSGKVYSVSFSPDGKTIASASEGGTVKLWNPDGELIKTLAGHIGEVYSVSFSPDGKTIASASEGGTVKLWNPDGELIKTLAGHIGEVYSVSFSPDGKTIASAGRGGEIKLWNLDGELIKTLAGHPYWNVSVSFSPDGRTIASAGRGGEIKLWNLDGELIKTLAGHSNGIESISYSPDGKTLASASRDGTIKLWNPDGEVIETLAGHSAGVNSVSFSPDGKTLASASRDGTIKLWNPDGEVIETLAGHSAGVNSVSFSPDGKTLASASVDGTIKLWRNPDGEVIETLSGHQEAVSHVSYSPDGKTLASASVDGTIKLWNPDGELIKTLAGHSAGVNSVSYSPDGKTLASASVDGTIKLWNPDGEVIGTLSGHPAGVNSVSYSPDGKTLASASVDGTIELWNPDGEVIETLSGHLAGVNSVSYSPDGKTLASASVDGTIKLWNPDGEVIKTFAGHSAGVSSVSFSPDGKTLASAGTSLAVNAVKLWSLNGELIETLSGHLGQGFSVSFDPNSEILASAGVDGTVRLWNSDGEMIETLAGHVEAVFSVSFSPDGQTLATGSGDGTVKLWDRNLESLLTSNCDWLVPYLRNNPEGQRIAEEGICEEYL